MDVLYGNYMYCIWQLQHDYTDRDISNKYEKLRVAWQYL